MQISHGGKCAQNNSNERPLIFHLKYTNPARGILDFCKQQFFGPSNASNKPYTTNLVWNLNKITWVLSSILRYLMFRSSKVSFWSNWTSDWAHLKSPPYGRGLNTNLVQKSILFYTLICCTIYVLCCYLKLFSCQWFLQGGFPAPSGTAFCLQGMLQSIVQQVAGILLQ